MTVAGETDPNGSMRAEIFARLDAHLEKSKREVHMGKQSGLDPQGRSRQFDSWKCRI